MGNNTTLRGGDYLIGKIHSFESFGTVDGPGIRFVIFLKGCPLRCQYCHNPDTWSQSNAKEVESSEIVKMVLKYKNYFANGGGVTVTGGEPLLQIDFVIDLFKLLKKENIHTCVDTSGYMFDGSVNMTHKHLELNKVCDLFLVDIKHMNDLEHLKLTSKSNANTFKFVEFLEECGKPMWIRHVLIPGITTEESQLQELHSYLQSFKMVEKIEILPYHKLGVDKYAQMGLEYPLKGVEAPTKDEIKRAKEILEIKR